MANPLDIFRSTFDPDRAYCDFLVVVKLRPALPKEFGQPGQVETLICPGEFEIPGIFVQIIIRVRSR